MEISYPNIILKMLGIFIASVQAKGLNASKLA